VKAKNPLIAMFLIYIVILNPKVLAKNNPLARNLDAESDQNEETAKH
jgi:hypothetical protein